MKKQGMLLVLCLVFAMVPTMAAAARTETDGSAIATQVAERKSFGDVPAALPYTTEQEWEVLRLTNLHRADAGLPMLVTTDVMQKIAGVRSDELMESYSHTRPDGSSPFTVIDSVGLAYQMGAENIAEGQRSADEVVTDWMGSPGHRANILMPELRYLGTGVSYDSNLHWVQLFITPENSDCQSISFDRELGYFTLKLQNGATAYAPYLMDFPPQEDEAVTFAYPGVTSIEGGAGKPAGQTAKKGHPFIDVKAGSYYEDAVVWALKNKVTSGTTATTFSPDATCTRGEVVTFLWRSKGSPAPESASNPFVDVQPSDYFYQAVLWAVENGITGGTSATTFSPAVTCTSGQVVTFLWRSNGSPSKTGQGSYYADAVNWGNAGGLLAGTAIVFAPANHSPRADVVTYLYRNSTAF